MLSESQLHRLLPVRQGSLVWDRSILVLLGHVSEVFRWDQLPQLDGVVPGGSPSGFALLVLLLRVVLVLSDCLQGAPEPREPPLDQHFAHACPCCWWQASVDFMDSSSAPVVFRQFGSCLAFTSCYEVLLYHPAEFLPGHTELSSLACSDGRL